MKKEKPPAYLWEIIGEIAVWLGPALIVWGIAELTTYWLLLILAGVYVCAFCGVHTILNVWWKGVYFIRYLEQTGSPPPGVPGANPSPPPRGHGAGEPR